MNNQAANWEQDTLPKSNYVADPVHLWETTSGQFKMGWLKHKGYKPEYSLRHWDDLPAYVQQRWQSELEE